MPLFLFLRQEKFPAELLTESEIFPFSGEQGVILLTKQRKVRNFYGKLLFFLQISKKSIRKRNGNAPAF